MAVTNALPRTEAVVDAAIGIDIKSDAQVLGAVLDGQRRAVDSVAAAIPALVELGVTQSH